MPSGFRLSEWTTLLLVGLRQPDLERLLDLYEISGDTRAALLALGRQAAHRGWWHSSGDALPAYFEDYVGLEDGAKSLLTYQNQLVHGLMQTQDYAAAVIRAAQPAATADEIERQLAPPGPADRRKPAQRLGRPRRSGPAPQRRRNHRHARPTRPDPGNSSPPQRHTPGAPLRYRRARVNGHLIRAAAVPRTRRHRHRLHRRPDNQPISRNTRRHRAVYPRIRSPTSVRTLPRTLHRLHRPNSHHHDLTRHERRARDARIRPVPRHVAQEQLQQRNGRELRRDRRNRRFHRR